jgi:hypothetical protein
MTHHGPSRVTLPWKNPPALDILQNHVGIPITDQQ